MSRVTKKFFMKLAPVAIGMVYVFVVLEVAALFEDPFHGFLAGALMVIGPMLAYMLYETWQQAKREVEQENEIMMRTLKDS